MGDDLVLTPDFGGKPFFLNTPEGGLLGQFRTFSLASIQYTLLPLMQNPVAAANWQFILATTALSAIATTIKGWGMGGYKPETPESFLWEVIDKAGILGIVGDADMAVEALTGWGITPIFEGERSRINTAMGALSRTFVAAKLLEDISLAAGAGSEAQQIRAIKGLIPFNNHALLLNSGNEIMKYFNNKFGIKDRTK